MIQEVSQEVTVLPNIQPSFSEETDVSSNSDIALPEKNGESAQVGEEEEDGKLER